MPALLFLRLGGLKKLNNLLFVDQKVEIVRFEKIIRARTQSRKGEL
jgi:hypothetical protein